MPEKVFFHAYIQSLIDCWSTLRDSASAHIRRPFSSLHNRAIKIIILLKITTLAISDYNLLSILPLKERLGYNKGVLTHKGMSGNIPLKIVRQNVPKTNHDITRLKLYDKMFLKPITTFWKAQYTNL